jgi:hypothetical protein
MPFRFNPLAGHLDWTDPAAAESDPIFAAWLAATPPVYPAALASYVPYTGATTDLIMGAHDITTRNLSVLSTKGTELVPALQAANWTVGAGWAAPAGTLDKNADGSGTATPTASMGIQAGHRYKVAITLSYNNDPVNRAMNWTLGGTAGTALTTTGNYLDYVTAATTANIIFTPSLGGNRETITAVSVIDCTLLTGDLLVEENARVYGQMGIGSEMNAAAGLTIDRPLWAKIKGCTFKTGIVAPLYICGGSSAYNPSNANSGMFFENSGSANGYFICQFANLGGHVFGITNAGNVCIGAIPGTGVPASLSVFPGSAITNIGCIIKGSYSADTQYQDLLVIQDRSGNELFGFAMRGSDQLGRFRTSTLSTTAGVDSLGLRVLTSGNAAQYLAFKGIFLGTSYTGATGINGGEIRTDGANITLTPNNVLAVTISASDQSATVVGDVACASIKTGGNEFLKHKVIRKTLSSDDASTRTCQTTWGSGPTVAKLVMIRATYRSIADATAYGCNDYDAGFAGHWIDCKYDGTNVYAAANASSFGSWAENDIIQFYMVYEK